MCREFLHSLEELATRKVVARHVKLVLDSLLFAGRTLTEMAVCEDMKLAGQYNYKFEG